MEQNELFEFDRRCDVLWSPDSKRIALTNWYGSNASEILLLDVGHTAARTLKIANLREFVSEEEQGGHFYYDAEAWEFQNKLRIRIFGHTDEDISHAFSRTLSVETSSGWAVLLKKSDREDGK